MEGEAKRKLKVLYYIPSLGYSHVQFNGKLAEALIDRGHEVHLLMPEVDPSVGTFNGTTKATKVFRFPTPGLEAFKNPKLVSNYFDGNYFAFTKGAKQFWLDMVYFGCETTVEQKELLDSLKSENYDIGIGEALSYCPFALFHYLGISPTFSTTAIPIQTFVTENFGLTHLPSFMPIIGEALINGENLNFMERIKNLYIRYCEYSVDSQVYRRETQLFQKHFGHGFPDLKKLLGNVSYAFTNAHPMLSFSKPITNKVVYLGGGAVPKAKGLTKEFEEIYSKAKKGVVIFSFGSLHKAFIDAFERFSDYEFIWKINSETEELAKSLITSSNIHLVSWIDQISLLNHPQTKAFITQCGLNSVNEATYTGVPMIAIPLFADQFYNAAVVKHKEIGVVIKIGSMKSHDVEVALHEILHNPKYKKNIDIVKRKLELYPFNPLEEFVKRVEYAAEFDNLNELNLASANLSFFKVYYLDIIGTIFAVIAFIYFCLFV
uniref:Glucuronosyltransferase n=1 Tax=Panagrolaimus sp. ES5 TaxID=591445 RepID=A0AC34FL16_9BILA